MEQYIYQWPMNFQNQSPVQRKVHEVIEQTVGSGKIVSRITGKTQHIFPVAISDAEGRALQSWIAKEKPKTTIEIGLAYGVSTLFICEALLKLGNRKKRHTVLDPYQQTFKNLGLQVLKDAGVLSVVNFVSQQSEIALPHFIQQGRNFDFAFVDGSHLFDKVFIDLIFLGRLVKPGGVIFADDFQAKAVAKAVSFCLKNLGWKLEQKSHSNKEHQWIVLRTPRKPRDRSYPHFVNF